MLLNSIDSVATDVGDDTLPLVVTVAVVAVDMRLFVFPNCASAGVDGERVGLVGDVGEY